MFKTAGFVPRQAARAVFGGVLVIGALDMVWRICLGIGHIAHVLEATWAASVAAAALAYVAMSRLRRPLTPHDRQALARASFVVPAVGLALVLPLSLHLAVFPLVFSDYQHLDQDFDGWAMASAAVTGLAHIVFAVLMWRRASALVRGQEPMSVMRIYLWVIFAGTFPLPGWPWLFIAITGLPILPIMHFMRALAERERDRNHLPQTHVKV